MAASAPFEHVIITRFSAVFDPGQPPPDPAWLEYRLGFFVDACLASVAGQRGHALFRWLVFFDDRCDPAFRGRVERLAEGRFEPVFSHGLFWSELPARIAERTSAPHLITTRLDSDDAIAVDFVAAVQREFVPVERLYLNFARGLQIDRSGAVYRRDYPSGPFLSMIEARQADRPPSTVFSAGGHRHARRSGPLREVVAPPMWVQVVHGSNLANDVRGTRVRPQIMADRFTLDLPYDREVTAARFAREWSARALAELGGLLRHRHRAIDAATAALDRLVGTRTKPRRAARSRPR